MIPRLGQRHRFCNSPWFHQCALETIPEYAARTVFATVWRDGQLEVVLPLCVRIEKHARIKFRSLELSDRPELFVNDGAVADEESVAAALPAMLRMVRELPEFNYDYVAFRHLPPQSGLLRACARNGKVSSMTVRRDRTRFVGVGPAGRMSVGSKESQRSMRRRAKRLAEFGPIVYRTAPADLPIEEAFQLFLEIEASGWKGAAGTGSAIALSSSRTELYRRMLESREGASVHIHLLYCGDRAIAAQYTVLCGSTVTALTTGYVEEFARYGPGYLLSERVLSWCEAEPGVTECDFYSGAAWFDQWRPDERILTNHYHFRASPKGVLAHILHRLKWRRNTTRIREPDPD